MKSIIPLLIFILPSLAFAAGGFVLPDFLAYPLMLLLLAFPLTFLYIGYLVLRVEKSDKRRFVWMYVLALCLAVLAFVCLTDLMANENRAWVENLFGIFVLIIPVYTAYISYGIDNATEGRHSKQLRFCWKVVLTSIIVFVGLPMITIYLPQVLDWIASVLR